ncbi:hypothetical protein EWM64_g5025, partial [Hericium alpestre]
IIYPRPPMETPFHHIMDHGPHAGVEDLPVEILLHIFREVFDDAELDFEGTRTRCLQTQLAISAVCCHWRHVFHALSGFSKDFSDKLTTAVNRLHSQRADPKSDTLLVSIGAHPSLSIIINRYPEISPVSSPPTGPSPLSFDHLNLHNLTHLSFSFCLAKSLPMYSVLHICQTNPCLEVVNLTIYSAIPPCDVEPEPDTALDHLRYLSVVGCDSVISYLLSHLIFPAKPLDAPVLHRFAGHLAARAGPGLTSPYIDCRPEHGEHGPAFDLSVVDDAVGDCLVSTLLCMEAGTYLNLHNLSELYLGPDMDVTWKAEDYSGEVLEDMWRPVLFQLPTLTTLGVSWVIAEGVVDALTCIDPNDQDNPYTQLACPQLCELQMLSESTIPSSGTLNSLLWCVGDREAHGLPLAYLHLRCPESYMKELQQELKATKEVVDITVTVNRDEEPAGYCGEYVKLRLQAWDDHEWVHALRH